MPTLVCGLFAKTKSFLLKHSSTKDGEETISKFLEPIEREMIGPCLSDMFCNVLWIGVFRRCKWPIMGSEGGLGGRFLCHVFFLVKSLDVRKINRRVDRK